MESWRATELAIEAFTLELARRCGYNVAFGRCATWETKNGVVRGFVSRKFHDTTEQQFVGGQLLASKLELPADLTPDVLEARRRVLSTLELTRDVLREQEGRYRVDLLAPFLRMLVFDAWIGNGDRHSANWAILVRGSLHGSACRLAPMYDTAGCLLADLTDETVERRFGSGQSGQEDAAVQRYAEKCRSGFGDGVAKPGLLHVDLLERLRGWPEWSEIAAPLIGFFFENLPVVSDLLGEVPSDWLSERRKDLIRRLLEARVMMLRGFVP
jgi:hypothetical protein